jgi:hypothetical protein
MKKVIYVILTLHSFGTYAQVGIGTTSPQATLDVRESNPASPTAEAGIAIPQVSTLPSSGNRSGQIVFLTTSNLYYCYVGTLWQPLYTQVYNYGDVKYGFEGVDHNGWIQLDGRAKSTLTSSQQTAATSLGIGANLPNISDKTIVGVSGTKTLNTTGGSSITTISQNQLPNVTLSTSSDGAHTHMAGNQVTYLLSLIGFLGYPILNASSNTAATSSSGAHSHTTSSINGGVVQQSLSTQNPYLALNGFIYLGS